VFISCQHRSESKWIFCAIFICK